MRVELVTRAGRELPIVIYQGDKYAQGEEGEEYTIRLINDSAYRRLAVVTVDGVNIVSGEDGKFDGDGYVLRPWETLNIEGWRRDETEAATFKFGKIGESYANKTGRGESNVGVIGVAVFDEARLRRPVGLSMLRSTQCSTQEYSGNSIDIVSDRGSWDLSFSASMDSAPITSSAPVSTICCNAAEVTPQAPQAKYLVNEYGKKVEFKTMTVAFEKKPQPSEVIKVRYASKEVLRSWGVPVDAVPPKPPEAFPADKKGVPAPPGWQG